MQAFLSRRKRLGAALDAPALLFAGQPRARNYAANVYPFRAESHFLYLAGISAPGAALLVEKDRSTLFVARPEEDDALWHGEVPTLDAYSKATGADDVLWADALPERVKGRAIATLPVHEGITSAFQSSIVGRPVLPRSGAKVEGADAKLADAMIALRLHHDAAALAEMKVAVSITERAHHAGAKATKPGVRESVPRAAIEFEYIAAGVAPAYGSIVTVHGEVLHMDASPNPIVSGDLLLVDAGAESPSGWASDVTRVYPASGKFSATQRAIYDVVLAANRAAIAMVRPGARYRDIHLKAGRTIVEGLVALGIFRVTSTD